MTWQNEPFSIRVRSGDVKAFCSCGASNNAPYCDGRHSSQGEGKQPIVVTFDHEKTIYVCGCQKSQSRPFCDGSHSK